MGTPNVRPSTRLFSPVSLKRSVIKGNDEYKQKSSWAENFWKIAFFPPIR
jgi:hypothetical protein